LPDRRSPTDEDLLLAVYQLERQEQQASYGSQGVLLAATLTVVVAIGLMFRDAPDIQAGWLYAVLPLVPLPLIALETAVLSVSRLRFPYIAECERRLARSIGGLAVPSFHEKAQRVWTCGAGLLSHVAVSTTFVGLYVAVLIESYRTASHKHEHTLALAVLIGCGVVVGGCVILIARALSFGFFAWVRSYMVASTPPPAAAQRSAKRSRE
jgi:hypothetical protein